MLQGSDDKNVDGLQAVQAEQEGLQLLEAMKCAEQVVERQTNLGMRGLASIFDVANHLVSAEMLRNLHLPKAQGLGSLQVWRTPILSPPLPSLPTSSL